MTVAITHLRLIGGRSARGGDADARRRMQRGVCWPSLLVLEGWSREAAAEACAMHRQTLRDWVHRYNGSRLGRACSTCPAAMAHGLVCRMSNEPKVAEWIEQGPDLERDGVIRWRCVDLQQRILQEFAIPLHERTVGKLLRKLSFRRLSVRPQHPQGKAEEQAVFSAVSPSCMTAALPLEAAGRPVEVWFTDEARVGQHGTLTRVWAKRGSRPRAPRDRRYEWAYLFGAVCPERSTGAAIIMPEVNVEAMNEHLAEISRRVSVGAIALLVLDQRGLAQFAATLGAQEYRIVAVTVLLAGIKPGGKCLGVPARQLSQPPCLGGLRCNRGRMLRGLEQADANARPPRFHHQALNGQNRWPDRAFDISCGRIATRPSGDRNDGVRRRSRTREILPGVNGAGLRSGPVGVRRTYRS